MRLSRIPFKKLNNNREIAYFVQEVSGIFSVNVFGKKLIEHIINIVKAELNSIAVEIELSILQDMSSWKKTNRDLAYGKTMFRLEDRNNRPMCLVPTCEESVVEFIKSYNPSYKQLPLCVYQIATKYRDEMRPRLGMIRSRQFLMKDAYSFAATKEDHEHIYREFKKAYVRIFEKLHIPIVVAPSDSGEIGGDKSEEFDAPFDRGESTIYYEDGYHYVNSSNLDEPNPVSLSKGSKSMCSIELAEIFSLGTIYSDKLDGYFVDASGCKQPYIMGCYGIGISRIASFLLYSKDYLPKSVAPFSHILIAIDSDKSEEFYASISNKKHILYYDLGDRGGFSVAETLGIPVWIVIGKFFEIHNKLDHSKMQFSTLAELIEYVNRTILNI